MATANKTPAQLADKAIAKRDNAPPPRVEVLAVAKSATFPAGKMLISSPLEIQAVVMRIPEGRVLTLSALRNSIAKSHKADYACPLTTGIFLRVCAEAADVQGLGKKVPYWRVVRDDGSMLEKLPGGPEAQAKRLRAEGVELFGLSKRVVVADLEGAAWNAPPLGKSGEKKAKI